MTEVQYIWNRFQHVVQATVTIWDYLFHGIPQQRVFTRQFRVHMFGIIPLLTIVLPTFSFWRHTARQFAIQYSCFTPGTECMFKKKKFRLKNSPSSIKSVCLNLQIILRNCNSVNWPFVDFNVYDIIYVLTADLIIHFLFWNSILITN